MNKIKLIKPGEISPLSNMRIETSVLDHYNSEDHDKGREVFITGNDGLLLANHIRTLTSNEPCNDSWLESGESQTYDCPSLLQETKEHYLLGSVPIEGMLKGSCFHRYPGHGITKWDKYQEGMLEKGSFMVVGGLLDKCDCGTKICEIKKVDPRRYEGPCNGNGLISLFRGATKEELEIANEIYGKGSGK